MGSLDPAIANFLALAGTSDISQVGDGLDLSETRTMFETTAQLGFAKREEMDSIRDLLIGDQAPVKARLYLPSANPLALVTYFHGGGFVLGSVNGFDNLVRYMAKTTGYAFLSVDYRLAPEHRFPAAAEDAVSALEFCVREQEELLGKTVPLAVAGDSSGGNLAAVCAVHARNQGYPLAAQLLLYPAVAYDEQAPSLDRFAEGYFLTKNQVLWFREQYVPLEEPEPDWQADPYLADLSGVAPAVIGLAEFDPMHDFGTRYASKLAGSGVEVILKDFPSLIHGFANLAMLVPAAKKALDELLAALTSLLN
jgi:acetyl esterase